MVRRRFHLYLISDSTGETVSMIARAALAQFDLVEAVEHSWSLVRTLQQIEKVLDVIRIHRGVALYTLVKPELRAALEHGCREVNVPCIAVLEGVIDVLRSMLGAEVSQFPGRQHALDAGYYRRIEAMQFVLVHDDGQALGDIGSADVILVGVSRTSKTPTCIYLANRGMKAANIPFVARDSFPDDDIACAGPLVVGLTTSPERLVQIRRHRLVHMHVERATDYTDLTAVRSEISEARRVFTRHGWPVIDVSRRSIEETAAAILELYRQR